jgi:hypothetical protein
MHPNTPPISGIKEEWFFVKMHQNKIDQFAKM